MNKRHHLGNLAEAKVLAYLIERGYEVFLPFQDNGELDLIAKSNDTLYRVSVKGSNRRVASGNWEVTLKTVSRRNHGDVVVKKFDNTKVDLVAVYIAPLDKVVMLDASLITTTHSVIVCVEGDVRSWTGV